MTDHKLIEALSGATSLELYELSAIIDRLLADPRRIIAVRNKLNLGQTVRFMDARTGQMRSGKIFAVKDAQVVVQEEGTRQQWQLSCAAIELPSPAQPQREGFRSGDKVSFNDRYLQPQVRTITQINQRTASVDCGGSS